MPNTRSAKKRLRQNEVRRKRNRSAKSALRTQLRRVRDAVKAGEVLFILETEKVTYEVACPEDGTLGKILIGEKETVGVGVVVAYVLRPGEDLEDLPVVLEKAVSPEQP